MKEIKVEACGPWTLEAKDIGPVAYGEGDSSFVLIEKETWQYLGLGEHQLVLTSDGEQVDTVLSLVVNFPGGGAGRGNGRAQDPLSKYGPGLSPHLDPWEARYIRNARYSNGGGRKIVKQPLTWKTYLTPNGYSVRVPDRWLAREADTGKGVIFQRPENFVPKGTKGLDATKNSIRIMDPTAQHPNGYFRIYDKNGHPLDVFGNKVTTKGPAGHIDLQWSGSIKGWPQEY